MANSLNCQMVRMEAHFEGAENPRGPSNTLEVRSHCHWRLVPGSKIVNVQFQRIRLGQKQRWSVFNPSGGVTKGLGRDLTRELLEIVKQVTHKLCANLFEMALDAE
jgi:hypothetical protein